MAGIFRFLKTLTGVRGLLPDLFLEGVNVFLFLTDDWLDEYGGHLEFWSRDLMRGGQRALPSSGGLVLFSTSDFSYRGHPHPLSAPAGRVKRSFALYYDIAIRPTED